MLAVLHAGERTDAMRTLRDVPRRAKRRRHLLIVQLNGASCFTGPRGLDPGQKETGMKSLEEESKCVDRS